MVSGWFLIISHDAWQEYLNNWQRCQFLTMTIQYFCQLSTFNAANFQQAYLIIWSTFSLNLSPTFFLAANNSFLCFAIVICIFFSKMAYSSSSNDRHRRRRSSVLDYEQSLMFGQYREDLANFALTQAEKLTQLSEEKRNKLKEHKSDKLVRKSFKCGGDMIFFSTLAITLATLSFTIDIVVHSFFDCKFNDTRYSN